MTFDWKNAYWIVLDTNPTTHVVGSVPYFAGTGTPDGRVVNSDATYLAWLASGNFPGEFDTYDNLMLYINRQLVQDGDKPSKSAVRAATTANITLSGEQTVDGVALISGDRVLVKDQSSSAENGLYVVQAGAWARSSDADTAQKMIGASVWILPPGSTNPSSLWFTDWLPSNTLGTSNVNWYWIGATGSAALAARTISSTDTIVFYDVATGMWGKSLASNTFQELLTVSGLNLGAYVTTPITVDFNSANTDNLITVNLPAGFTRYRIAILNIGNASGDISTATYGLFTATGGGGTAIVSGGTAITVTTSSANTANNYQGVGMATANTTEWTDTSLYFRVGTAQGSAATGKVSITYWPVS